jgi:hypothetical protein
MMKSIHTEDLTADKLNQLLETIDEMFAEMDETENES